MSEMFDETIFDGRTFDELHRALDMVLERMDKIKEELEDDEDDLRLDALQTVVDCIVRRMDSLVREFARDHPGDFSQWYKVMRDYEVHYDKYTDSILQEETIVDLESPETS